MTTLGTKLATYKGIGPGFDFLRVVLSVSVVAWHVDAAFSGDGTLDQQRLIWFPGYGILAMFFALSGFLIAGSAGRLSLGNFLINRGLRILPALFVEVVLSAFVLGVLFTKLPASVYFGSFQTWHYLTNIIGIINYVLPGVFLAHPTSYVNLSLWTVPYEYGCYALISFIMVFGLLKRPSALLSMAGFVILVGLIAMLFGAMPDAGGVANKVLSRFFIGHQSRLFVAFLLGITVYIWRDRIVYSHYLAIICVVTCVIIAALGPADHLGFPVINLIAAPCLVYFTAYLGVSNLPVLPLFHRGDYSYGIYLYGFPIQQVIFDVIPVKSEPLQFILAAVAISFFAAFSWHCIEKPILRMRKRFSFVSRLRLADDAVRATATLAGVNGPGAKFLSEQPQSRSSDE